MQLTYLIKGLELGPWAVQRIVERVPETAYDIRLDPERFTFRESVAHLADWEPINIERLRRGVEEPGCTVEGYDEGQVAIDRNYAIRDPRQQISEFVASRAETISFLKTLSDADWHKRYFHSERGEQTVYEQAVSMLGHDMYHLEQFTQYLG